MAKKLGDKQPPNVKLRAKADAYTEGEIQVGGRATPIILPSTAEQRKGFYLDPVEVNLLMQIAGDRYARVANLGEGDGANV